MSEVNIQRCTLCGQQPESGGLIDFDRRIYGFVCNRCGKYQVTAEACNELGDIRLLRCATRQASEAGRTVLLTTRNLKSLASEHEDASIPRNLDKFLHFLAIRCPRPGMHQTVDDDRDYPVMDALSPVEFGYIKQYAEELGLVRASGPVYWITPSGWDRLGGASNIPDAGRCFVAMAFHASLETAYKDGIEKAVRNDCGFDAVRMLELEHNDKICDRIVVEIRRAQFVIADFTFQRGGVYFEAGFAAALNRPVIWTCKTCHFHRLHFDTRQYNHIKWDTPADLRTQLAARIRGTISGAKLT